MPDRAAVHLEPWRETDLPLLEALLGHPTMMRHLGGPEIDEKIAKRHARYLTGADADSQFRIVDDATGEAVGWHGERRFVHAFPSVDNAPSNAVCRKTGFVLLGDYEFEYPPGSFMRCNDWRLDLLADGQPLLTR